jgi:hypothetical protein
MRPVPVPQTVSQTSSRRPVAAAESAQVLERRLKNFRGDLTVADAAARGGLALRDAEAALFHLSSEYHGHLKATTAGEVLFSFPRGMVKPEGQGFLARAARGVGRALVGIGRFVIRAWVSVVLIGYAVVLGAVLLALALKDDGGDGIGEVLFFVFRIIAEALFWTFHPFSPVALRAEPAWMRGHGRARHRRRFGPKDVPFYEKVNRFVFGPPAPKVDPRAQQRMLVAEIRRMDGRIGPADVMRALGGTREEAEAVLCRLVLDYDGEVEVTDDGAVVYKFAGLRRTADTALEHAQPAVPIWSHREKPAPLTGNSTGTNIFLGAINTFNLVGSGVALANGLTLEHLGNLLTATQVNDPTWVMPPSEGTPLVLGAIPFAFSAMLFVLPTARAIRKGKRERQVVRENARRALLRAVVEQPTPELVAAADLRRAWADAGAPQPSEAELTEEVRRLGGEPDVTDDGQLVYKFPDLAREARALAAERRAARPEERSAGEVIFSSLPAPDEG